MGNIQIKDGTAQGVAKVRHYEALHPPHQRLYYDPYAFAMYPGSFVQSWIGPTAIDTLYRWLGFTGLQEHLTIRTKWLDDMILEESNKSESKQLIILGAGYDTRGFRLDFPTKDRSDFMVWEVDQPEVQEKKISKLQWLVNNKYDDDNDKRIQDRINSMVHFMPVNFNKDSLEDKILSHPQFISNQHSIVTFEGVTQYIPKSSTADTLKKIKRIVSPGSIILMTYVDQNVFDNPSQVSYDPTVCQRIMKMASSVGEPWISGWSQSEFKEFMNECGYEVLSDTTTKDYHDEYLGSLEVRKMDPNDILSIERFVCAKVL